MVCNYGLDEVDVVFRPGVMGDGMMMMMGAGSCWCRVNGKV